MNFNVKENKFGKISQEYVKNKYQFGYKNLKVKKSVLINSPVFSLKTSYVRPNILAASDEVGNITIIDTNRKYKNSQSKSNNYTSNNSNINTLTSTEIEPISIIIFKLVTKQLHSNTIFDFDWCFSDNKIISGSGDSHCVIYDINESLPEYIFKGHSKSIKCIKQAFYNHNIFASCGRDGIILMWDVRENGKKIDINTTTLYSNQAEFVYVK